MGKGQIYQTPLFFAGFLVLSKNSILTGKNCQLTHQTNVTDRHVYYIE